jgi:hypothetical protein
LAQRLSRESRNYSAACMRIKVPRYTVGLLSFLTGPRAQSPESIICVRETRFGAGVDRWDIFDYEKLCDDRTALSGEE